MVLWNWVEFIWEFWAIALGSSPTFLPSDIGPSSLCLIPDSIRYNSILFFALLTNWSYYAERVYLCSFVLKSNQACTKYSLRVLFPLPSFTVPVDTRRRTMSYNIKVTSCVYSDSEIWGNSVWKERVKIPVNIWDMLDRI